MKTIFITSFHPLISRNILSTGLLKRLSEEARVIILTSEQKATYFRERFANKNIFVEGIDVSLSRSDIFLRQVTLACSFTRALYIKKRSQYYSDRRIGRFLANVLPASIVRTTRIAPWFIQTIDRLILRSKRFRSVFETYHPDLVFSTDIQNEFDVRLLSEARRRGVRSVGMVRSWDNLSSKGLLRIVPSQIVVHNDLIKAELARYNHVAPEKVTVVGIPHYDRYVNVSITDRAVFLRQFGLDPGRKTVLYAPIGDRYIRDNGLDAFVIETLSKIDVNILVRLPPTDVVSLPGEYKRDGIAVYQPGVSPKEEGKAGGGAKDSEIAETDEQMLIDSLANADVVVTGQSTIVIDAAAFDRPIVIIRFDEKKRAYWDSVRKYYDYEYYLPISSSNGVRFADSPNGLLSLVEQYLNDPDIDRSGRERIIREQAFVLDGRATERLSRAVLNACP